jgi:hypothetical protein
VPTPEPGVRESSAVALAHAGDRTLAYVADEDTRTVRTVDVDAGRELAVTRLDATPSHVLLLPDGRLVVGLRDAARVQVLEPGSSPGERLEVRCAVEVPAEPVAFALTPDDAALLVSSGWGRTLGAYDPATLARRYEVPLQREPRAVLVTDDGRTAYVAHAVGGKVSRVDLRAPEHRVREVLLHGPDASSLTARFAAPAQQAVEMTLQRLRHRFQWQFQALPASCQGFALAKTQQPAGRILAPQVLVDPGDSSSAPTGYGNDNQDTEEPDVAVLDANSGDPFGASLERTPGTGRRVGEPDPHPDECLLPRAAAYDPQTRSLLVACVGTDALVAYDALAASPARAEKRRWRVAAGPVGVVVDSARHRAVVWSQFDRVLTAIALDGPEIGDDKSQAPAPVARVALDADPEHAIPLQYALGRVLFHAVGDRRISRDGRACASCHPDGRDDALTWATPEGPRRSMMLAGRLEDTAPFSWSSLEKTLADHLSVTFDRLHGAGGLRGVELEALSAYVSTLPLPVPPPPSPEQRARIARGAALFATDEVGCAGCHAGPQSTDHGQHDVKSKAEPDRRAAFNTPTLRFVGGTGPYFHDGRYATLSELLRGTDGTMGHTSQLSRDDLAALEAYVRSR